MIWCCNCVRWIKKRGSAGSPLEDKQTGRASQGPFPLLRTPGAPSHTVNQEACVTDGLFSPHKHGTPLETERPTFHCPLSAAHTEQSSPDPMTALGPCAEIKLEGEEKWPSIMYERKIYLKRSHIPETESRTWGGGSFVSGAYVHHCAFV